MKCPYCEEELVEVDYFTNRLTGEFSGEIYLCDNEECEANMFYIDQSTGKFTEENPY